MTYINEPRATVLADSVSPDGDRLTTLQVTMHRWVLAEFNTHRVFSRNSASSRAIPAHKNISRVREQPALPLSWPARQKGMQGGEELSENDIATAKLRWEILAERVANEAEKLNELGLHKSVTNRLLEPFLYQTIIVSSTKWDNFLYLRDTDLAQPEISVPAKMMRHALGQSTPQELGKGEWHTPLTELDADDIRFLHEASDETGIEYDELVKKVSAARCARVSYLTHDGRRDVSADLDLYERLTKHGHWSPLEHVATPCDCPQIQGQTHGRFNGKVALYGHEGNLNGWDQLRHKVGG